MTRQHYDEGLGSIQEVLRAPGSPLEPAARAQMEAHFGRDFSRVREHTDERAAASARALGARAYTSGVHIVFAAGRYNPWTRAGLWLLAHELAHVVQQDGEGSRPPLGVGDAADPLERAADQAADRIAAGRSLPPDFAFGAAPAGVIQRHVGPACGGVPISPDPITGNVHQPTDWLAHLAIEDEYVHAFAPEDDVFYSRFWTDNTRTLRGRLVNRNFATELLNALRFWPIGNRPNIIDFGRRRAYFVRIVPFRADYSGQINRFHDLVRQLGRKHNEQAWNPSEAAIWYPAHNLPLDINDPLDTRFVCTQATEYNLGPGLILYDIRREKDEEEDRRSRQRRVQTFTNLDVDQDYADVWPTMRSEIPTQVQYYDTAYPDYVVIVPREFHSVWTSRKADQRNEYARGFYRPRPSFDFPGGHFVKDLKRQLYYASLVIGGISLAVVVVAASAVGAAYAAGAESIALAEAGTAARGAAVVDELAVARAAKAARSGLAVGGGLTAAREVVKRAAAATLLGFGIAKNARAGTLEPVQSGVITAVPIAQFYMDATTLPSATRDATPIEYYADYSKVPEVVKSTFRLGAYVSFDYKPHVIVAKLTAK